MGAEKINYYLHTCRQSSIKLYDTAKVWYDKTASARNVTGLLGYSNHIDLISTDYSKKWERAICQISNPSL